MKGMKNGATVRAARLFARSPEGARARTRSRTAIVTQKTHECAPSELNSNAYTYTQKRECLKDFVFPSLGGMPRLLELPVFTS